MARIQNTFGVFNDCRSIRYNGKGRLNEVMTSSVREGGDGVMTGICGHPGFGIGGDDGARRGAGLSCTVSEAL
jgi:hypothetical protein